MPFWLIINAIYIKSNLYYGCYCIWLINKFNLILFFLVACMSEGAINLSSTYYIYKILSNSDFHFTGSFFLNIRMNIHIFGAPWFTVGRLNFVKSRCAPRVGALRQSSFLLGLGG